LVLDALNLSEYRESKKEVQLWKTTITSTGLSDDLRRVLPYMVAAAAPYMATDTGRQVSVELWENDPAALVIKGELPPDAVR
jgi:hypothetical protein